MWLCIGCLAVQFLAAGATKLLGAWSSRFADWGYPYAFAHIIGSLEIIGVIGLFFSRTRKWSTLLFIFIMTGAAYTHISNSEYVRIVHNAVVAVLSFLVLRWDRQSFG